MSSSTSLPSENLSPKSSALLKVISFLDPDRIQELILKMSIHRNHMEDYPKTVAEYEIARSELINSPKIWETALAGEIRTEKQIQDDVRNKLSPEEVFAVLNTVTTFLSAVWPFNSFEDRKQWETYEKYRPHCARLRDLWLEAPKNGNDTTFGTAILFNDMHCYMREKMVPDEIGLYAAASNAVLDNIKGHEDSESLQNIERFRISNELGMAIAFQDKGDGQKALEHANSAMKMVRDMESSIGWDKNKDPVLFGNCYNSIGIAYYMLNNTEESFVNWECSSQHFHRRTGKSELDRTSPVVNMSLVHCYRGEKEEAAKLLSPLWDLVETIGSGDETSHETGAILRAMGHLRVSQGKFDEALRLHQEALKNLRANLGDTHPMTADCMYNVAQDLLRLGNVEEAKKLLNEAIKVWGNDPRYEKSAARALWRKGKLLEQHFKDENPEEFIRQAMDIRKRVAGPEIKQEKDLKEADWTKLVPFYSR